MNEISAPVVRLLVRLDSYVYKYARSYTQTRTRCLFIFFFFPYKRKKGDRRRKGTEHVEYVKQRGSLIKRLRHSLRVRFWHKISRQTDAQQALSISSFEITNPCLSRRIKLRNMSRGIKNNWSNLSSGYKRTVDLISKIPLKTHRRCIARCAIVSIRVVSRESCGISGCKFDFKSEEQ